MGLDQYAYSASKAGQYNEFWETAEFDADTREHVNRNVKKPHEISYWRKHPNLQGWMCKLWERKMRQQNKSTDRSFNGIELELTWEDLDELERAIDNNRLPSTTGFFFGNDSSDYYREHDLAFIKNARAEIFMGLKVFYNSSW